MIIAFGSDGRLLSRGRPGPSCTPINLDLGSTKHARPRSGVSTLAQRTGAGQHDRGRAPDVLRPCGHVKAAFTLIQPGLAKVPEAVPLVCGGLAFVCATFTFVGCRVAGIGHLTPLVGVAGCVRRRTTHGVNLTTEAGTLRVGEAETSLGRVPSYDRRELAGAFVFGALLCRGLSLRGGLATPFGVLLSTEDGHVDVDEIVAVLA